MVAVVAVALIFAGFGSLALIRIQSRRDTVRDLRRQAQGIVELVDDAPATRAGAPALAVRQRVLQRVLRLEGQQIVRFTTSGQAIDNPPAGVSAADLRFDHLSQGQTVSGVNGTLAYAAAPGTTARRVPFAVVLTRHVGALPESLRDAFVHAVVDEIGAREGGWLLDYVRLNLDATRPSDS